MSGANEALVRRWTDKIWSERDVSIADEVFSPTIQYHKAPPGLPSGIEGQKAEVLMFRAVFPDFSVTGQGYLTGGDKVAVRWTAQGTHQGELMGIPPTGPTVNISGLGIVRIDGGKIVERWAEFDMLGLMQHLGAVPT